MAKTIAELESQFNQAFSTLEKRLNTIDVSIDALARKGGDVTASLGGTQKDLAVLKEQFEGLKTWKAEVGSLVDVRTDVAVLKNDVSELKKLKDAWGQRAWNLISAVIGVAVGALVTHFIRK